MAENGANGNGKADEAKDGAAATPPAVQMKILGQFVRDLSFENVMAQKDASGDVQPDVSVQVNLDAKKRQGDGQFEVIIKLNIESKAKDGGNVLFLMEIEYAGVFQIAGVPDDQMHPYLLIECPRMLFPFLRRIVSDVTRDGGYPPLNMDNIDFIQIYRAEMARQQAAQAPAGDTPKADA